MPREDTAFPFSSHLTQPHPCSGRTLCTVAQPDSKRSPQVGNTARYIQGHFISYSQRMMIEGTPTGTTTGGSWRKAPDMDPETIRERRSGSDRASGTWPVPRT